mmetsp:Transcript_11701/g.19526  ORF Transcript_11701/g.19526 Transcript_11701/m.19526 type:complete len:231 (-) Transcript_11701:231-923(-)
MARSMSDNEASPRSNKRIASAMYGTSSRLTMNPGVSLACTTVLPSCSPKLESARVVSALVCCPDTISTSFMTGTGLKKCMPPILDGSPLLLAMSSIFNDDVLLAKIASLGAAFSTCENNSHFVFKFSTIASITKLAFLTPSETSSVVEMRETTSSFHLEAPLLSLANFFFATRPILSPMRFLASPSDDAFTSINVTLKPCCAATCAIPEPINPAPTTEIDLPLSCAFSPF